MNRDSGEFQEGEEGGGAERKSARDARYVILQVTKWSETRSKTKNPANCDRQSSRSYVLLTDIRDSLWKFFSSSFFFFSIRTEPLTDVSDRRNSLCLCLSI